MNQDWREQFAIAFADRPDLFDGDSDAIHLSIDHIELMGGEKIPLQAAGVTVIVGANNAGKSTILRETWEKLSHMPGHPALPAIAVKSLSLSKRGTPADAIAWLGEAVPFVSGINGTGFQLNSGVQHPAILIDGWRREPLTELGTLAQSLVFYGNAQARFSIGGAAEMRDSVSDPATHPVHHLQDSRELLDEINSVCHVIFGTRLTLDTLGRTLRLRVGEVGLPAPRIDDVSPEYRDQMAELRPLDEQGDGMRSLMGQLLPLVTSTYKAILIDEPEAFLHPPQAHALGKELGRLAAKTGLQIILATHDRSLLAGLLDSNADVSVVRLTRDDGPARASLLDSGQLRDLWTDPVLKYTNVLDGLFHRLVVIAEAEGDCAFLAAGMDSDTRGEGPVPRNEVLFVPTGGKDGMSKVCAALNAVNVPVVAAPDLDMLSDMNKLKLLVEAVGGSWTPELASLWKVATSGLNAPKEAAKVGHVLDAIGAALEGHRNEPYSSDFKEVVLAQIRSKGSAWTDVKMHGLSAFKGDAFAAAEVLVQELAEIGIVLVREGELERLAPRVAARKGPGWLQAALSAGEQHNVASQAHIDRILLSGGQKLRKSPPSVPTEV